VAMPIVAIGECILIGWFVGPKWVIDEFKKGGFKFGREKMYKVFVKFVTPILLFVLFLQAFGVFN
jgi:NSS family neurotransmitter:Na+ symporter